MKKQTVLKITNPILLVLIVWQVGSGLFHTKIPYEVFGKAHPIAGYMLFGFIVLHLVLNWSWVKMSYFRKGRLGESR